MAVIRTSAPQKTAFVPVAVFKTLEGIRKDAAFILQTVQDEHGVDTAISARMIRYTLADASAAFGRKDSTAQARGLVYLVTSFLNGTNGLDGLTKPLPKWLSQVFRAHFETIRPYQPTADDVLQHVGAILDRAEKVGVAPKKAEAPAEAEAEAPTEADTTADGQSNAAHNKRQDQIARKLRARTTAARRIRELRAQVRALQQQLAEAVQPKKRPAKLAA